MCTNVDIYIYIHRSADLPTQMWFSKGNLPRMTLILFWVREPLTTANGLKLGWRIVAVCLCMYHIKCWYEHIHEYIYILVHLYIWIFAYLSTYIHSSCTYAYIRILIYMYFFECSQYLEHGSPVIVTPLRNQGDGGSVAPGMEEVPWMETVPFGGRFLPRGW